MTLTAAYSDDFSRVLLEASNLDANVAHMVIDRSIDGVHWTVVRGASDLEPTFTDDVLNDNPYFETNVASWSSVLSTISQSTLHAHGASTGSMRIVPDNASAIRDTFNRSVASGWGSADSGEAWSTSGGTATNFSVDGNRGLVTLDTVNVERFTTLAVSLDPIDVTMTVSPSQVATGGWIVGRLLGRFKDTANYYGLQIEFKDDGTVGGVLIKEVAGAVAGVGNTFHLGTYSAGERFRVRLQISGTTLRGKIWREADVEPSTWTNEGTDTAITGLGAVATSNLTLTGNTNSSPVLSWDELRPGDVDEFVGATSEAEPVEQGKDYTNTSWVYSVAGWSEILVGLLWLDAGSVVISESLSTLETPVAADTWTAFTVTAQPPVNAVSVQMRVLMGNVPVVSNELFVDDSELTTPVGSAKLDDYEFTADVENTYRATYYDAAEVQVGQDTVAITPVIDSVWLKSVARPFLNMRLRNCAVADGQISRRGRGGVFDVIGRTNPVAVSDVRSAIEFTLRGATTTFAEAKALDYLLMSGDILFIQAPATSRVPTVHAFCGDSSRQLKGTRTSEISAWLLPMSEVAKPGAFIIGVLATWRTVTNRYATWADVSVAHATWASVRDIVADPSEVVIP